MSNEHGIVRADSYSSDSHLVSVVFSNSGNLFEVVFCLKLKLIVNHSIVVEWN